MSQVLELNHSGGGMLLTKSLEKQFLRLRRELRRNADLAAETESAEVANNWQEAMIFLDAACQLVGVELPSRR